MIIGGQAVKVGGSRSS